MSAKNKYEIPSPEVAARRRRIAMVAAGLLLSPWLVRAEINAHHYGYHGTPPAAAEAGHNK